MSHTLIRLVAMAWILLPFSGLRDRKATICGGISKINQCQMSEMVKYLNILTKKLLNSSTVLFTALAT